MVIRHLLRVQAPAACARWKPQPDGGGAGSRGTPGAEAKRRRGSAAKRSGYPLDAGAPPSAPPRGGQAAAGSPREPPTARPGSAGRAGCDRAPVAWGARVQPGPPLDAEQVTPEVPAVASLLGLPRADQRP